MSNTLNQKSRHLSSKIVELSRTIQEEVETWEDVFKRVPNSEGRGVCMGFISKPGAKSGIEVVVDIQAPESLGKAKLRVWAAQIIKDDGGNERFNNVQFEFGMDFKKAQEIKSKANKLTREDFEELINNANNKLTEVVLSDLTGVDEKTGEKLGKRISFGTEEVGSVTDRDADDYIGKAEEVLGRIIKSAVRSVG